MARRLLRKCIRIQAIDSPNVVLAQREIALGRRPSHTIVVDGVLTYEEYLERRRLWDRVRQTIGLDALFYEGAEVLMYPPDWLDLSHLRAQELAMQRVPRIAVSLGMDSGEGGADSSWTVIDDLGIIEQVSLKTPNTTIIVSLSKQLIDKYHLDPQMCCFDRGGGGKQHADRLKEDGYPVRTVGFGESLSLDPKRGLRLIEEKIDMREEHYAYFDRRSEMAGMLRELLDPSREDRGLRVFAIPARYTSLREEMAPIPLTYYRERLRLLPKSKPPKPGEFTLGEGENADRSTLCGLIGRSPDRFDSLCLAVYAKTHLPKQSTAGAI